MNVGVNRSPVIFLILIACICILQSFQFYPLSSIYKTQVFKLDITIERFEEIEINTNTFFFDIESITSSFLLNEHLSTHFFNLTTLRLLSLIPIKYQSFPTCSESCYIPYIFCDICAILHRNVIVSFDFRESDLYHHWSSIFIHDSLTVTYSRV